MEAIGELGYLIGFDVENELKEGTLVEVVAIVDETRIVIEILAPQNLTGLLFTIMSSNFGRLIGYSKEELINGAIIQIIDPENVNRYFLSRNANYSFKVKKEIEKEVSKLSFNTLKSLFKYIPVKINSNRGFYNENLGMAVLDGETNITKKNNIWYSEEPALSYRRAMGLPNKKETKKNKYNFLTISPETVIVRFNTEILLEKCIFKIKSYIKSGKLFGYTPKKKAYLNQIVEVSKIELNCPVKKSEELQHTIYCKLGDNNYRMLLEDIEIIYPASGITNVNGLSPKKDRTIKSNNKVRVVTNKYLGWAKRNDKLVVAEVRKVGNKKYLGFKDNKTNKTVYENIKKFKLIQ